MKELFIATLVIALVMLCLSSCERSETTIERGETTVEKSETTMEDNYYSFNTVADLLEAIKYDPYKYADKEIQVKGTFLKRERDNISALVDLSTTYTDDSDLSEFLIGYHYRNDPSIDVMITDDLLNTVAECWDYMTVSGIVRITNGNIYLDNCTYVYN